MRKTKAIFIAIIVTVVLITSVFYFLPIDSRLNLLGYESEEDYQVLVVGSNTYEIHVNEEEIDFIQILNLNVDSIEYDNLDLIFFKDNKSIVQLKIYKNSDILSCEYNILGQELICQDVVLSDNLNDKIISQLLFHYLVLNDNIKWDLIPNYQR